MNLRLQAVISFLNKNDARIKLHRLRRAYQAACVKGVSDTDRYQAWLELSRFVDNDQQV